MVLRGKRKPVLVSELADSLRRMVWIVGNSIRVQSSVLEYVTGLLPAILLHVYSVSNMPTATNK